MKRGRHKWHAEVVRLQVGLRGWPASHDVCLSSVNMVLQAIVGGKNAEDVGAGILAALGARRRRGRVHGAAGWQAQLRQFREIIYTDTAISDSCSVPLIELLDAISEGGTAAELGARALDYFAVKRGRGRPKDEATEIVVAQVWNLYRIKAPIPHIASATGLTIGQVQRVLAPLVAAFGSSRVHD